MIQLLAVVHRHHHHHRYRPHLMEHKSPHPLLQSQQPDINITSVEKKLVTLMRYAKSYSVWCELLSF